MTRVGRLQPGPDHNVTNDSAIGETRETDTSRLWRPLSYRPEQPEELKSFDRAGEFVIGSIQRFRRRQSTIRRYSQQVLVQSKTMRSIGEKAFDEEIVQARLYARRGQRDAEHRIHAFAVVREAVRRTVGFELYLEQVMGGWAMEERCIAEMATGEGKTVTACLTAAVQAWMGYGVHVITVNDYLAQRDAELNLPVYKRLGLTVGNIQQETEEPDRREAYARDITYTSDQQLIFDFLRDRLKAPLQPRVVSLLLEELGDTNPGSRTKLWSEQLVLRGLYAAIVDEADSVLIDQATTPAIIGLEGGEDAGAEYYRVAAQLAHEMERDRDYAVDIRQHRVDITDLGREKLDTLADRLPPFWAGPRRREELVNQALVANELFQIEDHYIVQDEDVKIVDAHTGRVLEGRQWQLGLHQAVQAKEGLAVTSARQTMSRMSYQRFFQQYRRLAGMTGTAWEVRHELWKTYHLPVVRIPTHEPMIRKHRRDCFYSDQDAKVHAVANRVNQLQKKRQPVLLGTRSVEASEEMSRKLDELGVPHRILNAIRHEEEAAIVARAGKKGVVTVATNMAGRGTDIILDLGVAEMGGLVVIATERHDAHRVDRQLYGRSGRQGDPGLAETYLSLDDQLIAHSGIKVLSRFLRAFPSLMALGFGSLLWAQAQHTASRRLAVTRELVAKADHMFDRALYYENR